MTMPGSSSRSRRDSVVLPAPEGDDNTSMRPLLAMPVSISPSLDVLDLLAQLIDDGLELEPGPADLDVGSFRADRVRLAIELLRQKFEFASNRLVALDELVGCRDMSAQTIELLLDIGLGGKQQSFLVEPLGVEA